MKRRPYFHLRWQLYLVMAILFLLVSQWKVIPSLNYVRMNDEESPSLAWHAFENYNNMAFQNNKTSSTLPQWMTKYSNWHSQKLLQVQDWKQERLLIIRCVSNDRCGGTSDRLKSIPLFLALAAKTHRLLFVRWNRPFCLEEFLLPGPLLNWTVPTTLATILNNNNTVDGVYFHYLQMGLLVKAAENPNVWLVEGNVQSSGGNVYKKMASQLQATPQELEYTSFYHELFPGLFRPSMRIQRLVHKIVQTHELHPNQFVAAHYRSKYPGEPYVKTKNVTILEETVVNAIHCASSLAPGLPVYVASDTVASLQAAQRYTTTSNHHHHHHHQAMIPKVVSNYGIFPAEDPPHLNFAHKTHPSDFDSIFVDLILMANSRCVSFGAGGFGRFGSLLSFNATCRNAHSIKGELQQCPQH